MQPRIVHFLAGAEAARDQESMHARPVTERIIGHYREPGLGLHRAVAIGHQESIEFRIEAPSDGKDAIRGGEVDDFRILKDVNAEPESRNPLLRHPFLLAPRARGSMASDATSWSRCPWFRGTLAATLPHPETPVQHQRKWR